MVITINAGKAFAKLAAITNNSKKGNQEKLYKYDEDSTHQQWQYQ